MDTSRLIVLIFMVITTSECSETAEPPCEEYKMGSRVLLEGEACYYVPYTLLNSHLPKEEFTWYKSNSNISTDKIKRIHYQGHALFLLNALPEDSGVYTARHTDPSGKCSNYPLKIEVFKASHPNATMALLYGEVEDSDLNKMISCPDPVMFTCDKLKGKFTWYKDSKLLQGYKEDSMWVDNATRDDEGIYTCICTWEYNQKFHRSSGSRRLKVLDRGAYRTPEILSPTNKEQLADEGYGIKLNCSVFFGTNVQNDCHTSWYINGKRFQPTEGYSQTTNIVKEERSKSIISTAILTIDKVSAKDFETEFKCFGIGLYEQASYTLILKRRESIIPLVIGGVCVLFFCVLAAVLVKHFAIDLALFFRPYLPLSSRNKDARVYDAYVVYQMQGVDKVTEDKLCQFITENLPSVLEKKCGYRLFIHGRDDIPGEDRLELVEDRMKQSKRLMVILTPGSGSGSETTDQVPTSTQNSVIGGFDWQVGLHHALIQREMSVILIQLGVTGPQGYKHLPPGLQHLIHKSAPIKWPEGGAAAWNSRFWKRVRYLMPATPAKKCAESAII